MKKELVKEFEIYKDHVFKKSGKLLRLNYGKNRRVYIENALNINEEHFEWQEDTQRDMILTLKEANKDYEERV